MAKLTSAAHRVGAVPRRAIRGNSRIMKRSMIIAGHKTSVSLEDDFWQALREIAIRRNMRPSELVTSIDAERAHANLSSAIRLFVLDFYRLDFEARREPRPQRKESPDAHHEERPRSR
jgi:predicted DNA-binding ribbon-helix-helix protein